MRRRSFLPHAGDHKHGEDPADHQHGQSGPTAVVVRLDRLLAKVPRAEHAHGGHNHQAPASDELPGNIDQPMELVSSPDGTAFVTTLLDGVTLEGVFSGNLKYVDLHAAESEDSPTLACADLDDGN